MNFAKFVQAFSLFSYSRLTVHTQRMLGKGANEEHDSIIIKICYELPSYLPWITEPGNKTTQFLSGMRG